jgi:hypothetical protein
MKSQHSSSLKLSLHISQKISTRETKGKEVRKNLFQDQVLQVPRCLSPPRLTADLMPDEVEVEEVEGAGVGEKKMIKKKKKSKVIPYLPLLLDSHHFQSFTSLEIKSPLSRGSMPMERYGIDQFLPHRLQSLDVLDLTHNSLQDSMESIVASLSALTSLTELKLLDGNSHLLQASEENSIAFHLLPSSLQSKLHPTSSSSILSTSSHVTLSEVLPQVLPTLRRLDTNPIAVEEVNQDNSTSADDFHTWFELKIFHDLISSSGKMEQLSQKHF